MTSAYLRMHRSSPDTILWQHSLTLWSQLTHYVRPWSLNLLFLSKGVGLVVSVVVPLMLAVLPYARGRGFVSRSRLLYMLVEYHTCCLFFVATVSPVLIWHINAFEDVHSITTVKKMCAFSNQRYPFPNFQRTKRAVLSSFVNAES
jgi:hypothetical protein